MPDGPGATGPAGVERPAGPPGARAETLGSDREARWLLEDVPGTGGPQRRAEPGRGSRGPAAGRASAAGEPLQYVLGHWPFRSLDLLVDPRALIPRPETEQLVDVALAELDRTLADGGAGKVVDLGTGTGAIAPRHRDRAGWPRGRDGGDRSRCRRARAGPGQLPARRRRPGGRVPAGFVVGGARLRRPGAGSLLIVANPPYVAAVEWELLDPVVRDHEPYGAWWRRPAAMARRASPTSRPSSTGPGSGWPGPVPR